MQQITAPYGFVPLNDKIVFPEWLKCPKENVAPPLHDVPFQDGVSGTLELLIEAETPIFTRGVDKDSSQPFKLGDRYAIPGTALRGALRNLVEIISLSRFSRVNDHRYAVRDLHNRKLYGDHMAAIVKDARTGKGEPMPLVNAGWLYRLPDGSHKIEVCDFGKIEYRPLTELARERGRHKFNPGNKQSSVEKYRDWGGASLECEVRFDKKRPAQVGSRQMLSNFGLATPQPKGRRGTIVFTGQPSRWTPDSAGKRRGAGNPKHHDFVFLPADNPREIDVPEPVFLDFEFAHSDRGQQNRLTGDSAVARDREGKQGHSPRGAHAPNEEWGYWQSKLDDGKRVPVFFLTRPGGDGTSLRALGLAMMFRLGYEYSVGEAVHNVNADHHSEKLDFAEGLFGTVRDNRLARGERSDTRSSLALKGRIGISHALAEGSPRPEAKREVILGSPKASYYPNYVEQPRSGEYLTFMDKGAKPRGWKRYRALTQTWEPPLPTGGDGRTVDPSRVGTSFCPLPKGTRFKAHVDLHNLKPEEVGALLWAIELGQDEKARHTLGMARPLGYGRCRMSVSSHDVYNIEDRGVKLDDCRRAFEAYMEREAPGWKTSLAIRELLALARPVPPEQAKYQRLDLKEFSDAKKQYLSLPYACGHRPAPSAPARQGGPTGGGPRPGQGPGGPRHGHGPRHAAPSHGSSMGGLFPGGIVEGRLLEEKTKKGGWRAEAEGKAGPILNSGSVPGDAQPGRTGKLKVRSVSSRDAQFEWLE